MKRPLLARPTIALGSHVSHRNPRALVPLTLESNVKAHETVNTSDSRPSIPPSPLLPVTSTCVKPDSPEAVAGQSLNAAGASFCVESWRCCLPLLTSSGTLPKRFPRPCEGLPFVLCSDRSDNLWGSTSSMSFALAPRNHTPRVDSPEEPYFLQVGARPSQAVAHLGLGAVFGIVDLGKDFLGQFFSSTTLS